MYEKKITISLSAPYRHDQNGQIERDIQNVMDKTRTLMAGADVPVNFWCYALQMAIWHINRSPTSKSDNHTPLYMMYGVIPDMTDQIPFWCAEFCHVPKEIRDKNWGADWKAHPCRIQGYSELSTHAVKVYDHEVF
jgi:hypothetical protein